jgi:hypothetical protein
MLTTTETCGRSHPDDYLCARTLFSMPNLWRGFCRLCLWTDFSTQFGELFPCIFFQPVTQLGSPRAINGKQSQASKQKRDARKYGQHAPGRTNGQTCITRYLPQDNLPSSFALDPHALLDSPARVPDSFYASLRSASFAAS